MKPLAADFLPVGRPPRASWALTLALTVLAGAAAIATYSARQQVVRIEHAAAVPAMERTAMSGVAIPPYLRSAKLLLAERSSRWPDLLVALERQDLRGLTIRRIEIDANAGTVVVEAQFSSWEQLLLTLSDLNAGEPQPRWSLVQSQLLAPSAAGGEAVLRGAM